jgi:hypothetical protein
MGPLATLWNSVEPVHYRLVCLCLRRYEGGRELGLMPRRLQVITLGGQHFQMGADSSLLLTRASEHTQLVFLFKVKEAESHGLAVHLGLNTWRW